MLTHMLCLHGVFRFLNMKPKKYNNVLHLLYYAVKMVLAALNDSVARNPHVLSESLYTCYIYKPNADSHNSLYE